MKKTLLLLTLVVLGLTQTVAQDNDYLPIVREGVKWVNEKVIVNQGDTTRYYYKYEFRGNDPETTLSGVIYNACYYYTRSNLDVENDSLIAGLRENQVGNGIWFLRNNAYYRNLDEGKCLLPFGFYTYADGGSTLLYTFGEWGCDDFYLDLEDDLTYYADIWDEFIGYDVFLTEDNFYETDPIFIDGVECERYIYIGEDGDALAYVVEGIGFDSYDMGDLLTPFTCRPDPDADYQEWCGLSHVVKDGQIIYKGMRYRNGAVTGVEDLMTDKTPHPQDPYYYNLMGRAVGTEVPSTPGIYIHQGKKIVIR